MRIFCAIEIPDIAKSAILEHINSISTYTKNVQIKWEKVEKLHITIKFLGEISQQQLKQVIASTETIATTFYPIELLFDKTGIFPKVRSTKTLWVGIKDISGQLTKLKQNLEEKFLSFGLARDTKPFHPHITIARLNTLKNNSEITKLHQITNIKVTKFMINKINIIESTLKPEGSCYNIVQEIKLRS